MTDLSPVPVTSENCLSGAQLLVEILLSEGVSHVFCVTGAGNLAIVDALSQEPRISLIYSHHEQAAVMEAQGFARASGKLGVALVTTGGGTSNTVTGILSAHLDSIPILVISGNESSFHCNNEAKLRAYGVQGFDSVTVLNPITKMSKRIMEYSQIQDTFLDVISIAKSPRMGPVHIDFPMDLQRKQDLVVLKSAVSNDNRQIILGNENEKKFAARLFAELLKSKKPLVYIGNGCRDEKTLEKIKNIFIQHKIPYILSWSAIDLLPESDPLNIGRIGIYGDRASNLLLQQSDLLIVLGSRLAIPQTGYNKSDFARKATKWVVEVDDTECDKFLGLEWNVLNADVGVFLSELLNLVDWQNPGLQDFSSWREVIETTWKELPRLEQVGPIDEPSSGYVHSALVIDVLNSTLDSDAIISTDVGAALLSGHNLYEKKGTQRFFTSQGLGEMGFGLPAAIGAYFAKPTRQNVCLNTDGAMMFNLQELQVLKEYQIPLKLFVFNNSGYTMIKTSQDNLFDSRIAGSSTDTGISFPNFNHVAKTFGMEHILINSSTDLLFKIQKGLESDKSVLIEIVMNPQQKYLPRLATKKSIDGSLVSPPLEDLDPKISITQLERYLGYKPLEASFKSRES